jgi:hypothetical protein
MSGIDLSDFNCEEYILGSDDDSISTGSSKMVT